MTSADRSGRYGRSMHLVAVLVVLLAVLAVPEGIYGQDDGISAGTATVTFSAFACPPSSQPDTTPQPSDCREPLPDAIFMPSHDLTVGAGDDNAATVEVAVTAANYVAYHPRAETMLLECVRQDGEPVEADPMRLGLYVSAYDDEFHPGGIQDGDEIACTAYLALAPELGDGGASLTIHNRTCPPDYTGPDFYGACHDQPTPSDRFVLFDDAARSGDGGTVRQGQTDDRGNLTFADLPPAAYRLDGGLPGDFGHVTAFCARSETPGVQFPSTTERLTGGGPGVYRTSLVLAAGDDVTCDVYAIPADLS